MSQNVNFPIKNCDFLKVHSKKKTKIRELKSLQENQGTFFVKLFLLHNQKTLPIFLQPFI